MELNDEQNGSSWNLVVFIGLLFILLPVLLGFIFLVLPVVLVVSLVENARERRCFRRWCRKHEGEVLLFITRGKQMNQWVLNFQREWALRMHQVIVYDVHRSDNRYDERNMGQMVPASLGFPVLCYIGAKGVHAVSFRAAYRRYMSNSMHPEFFWMQVDPVLREWKEKGK